MYRVLKKLNDNIYEDFGIFLTKKEAEIKAKVIKVFIGGEILVVEE